MDDLTKEESVFVKLGREHPGMYQANLPPWADAGMIETAQWADGLGWWERQQWKKGNAA